MRGARMAGAVAAGALGVAGLAACGSVPVITPLTTARAIGQSFSAIEGQHSLQLEITIPATVAELEALHPHGATPAQLQAITQTTLRIDEATTNGASLATLRSNPSTPVTEDVALEIAGQTPVELRVVGGSLYLRTDIPGLLADYGVDPTKGATAVSGLEHANARIPGLAALAQGRWVEASAASLHAIEARGGDDTHLATEVRTIVSDLGSALRTNTTFANLGTHSGRTEYAITIAARGLADEVLADARTVFGTGPTASLFLDGAQRKVAEISPTDHIVVDEYVKGDGAEELDIDLSQLSSSLTGPLPLRIVIGTSGTVTAPSPVTPVDLASVLPFLHPSEGLPTCATTPVPEGSEQCGVLPGGSVQVPAAGTPVG